MEISPKNYLFLVNVNVCQDIMVIHVIEMDVAWNNEINVPAAPNVQRMKSVKRMNEPEIWNVDQFVKIFNVDPKQFVFQTIT